VIYCTIAPGPCQSSYSWIEVPQNSRPYFTVSFEIPPTWRARFSYLYPPGTGWPSYTPGHWIPFMSSFTTRRAAVRYSNPPPHGVACLAFGVGVLLAADSQSSSSSGYRASLWDPWPDFILLFFFRLTNT
jgi:hypothetical protein